MKKNKNIGVWFKYFYAPYMILGVIFIIGCICGIIHEYTNINQILIIK